jgi:hypothetical protein
MKKPTSLATLAVPTRTVTGADDAADAGEDTRMPSTAAETARGWPRRERLPADNHRLNAFFDTRRLLQDQSLET